MELYVISYNKMVVIFIVFTLRQFVLHNKLHSTINKLKSLPKYGAALDFEFNLYIELFFSYS